MKLATRAGYLFVATVDDTRIPHLAIADRIRLEGEDLVTVTAWFCPRTAENIDKNANISLVAWDREPDSGFQLVGTVE